MLLLHLVSSSLFRAESTTAFSVFFGGQRRQGSTVAEVACVLYELMDASPFLVESDQRVGGPRLSISDQSPLLLFG